MNWLQKIITWFGKEKCQGLEGPCNNLNATYQRQGSAYIEDKYNWACLCPECQKLANEYWKEMWNEYYRDRL